MIRHESNRKWIAVFIVAGLIVGMAACFASANEGHTVDQSSQVGHNHAGLDEASHTARHGGQLSETKAYCFEVVYWPRESRICLYDHDQRHLSVKGVSGEATIQIPGADHVVRFLAYYVTMRNPGEHDFLAVAADLSQVRDGDMRVAFALTNLPNAAEREVRFAQTFALSKKSVVVNTRSDTHR